MDKEMLRNNFASQCIQADFTYQEYVNYMYSLTDRLGTDVIVTETEYAYILGVMVNGSTY